MPEPFFKIGDVVRHQRLGYRAVVFEIKQTAPAYETWHPEALSFAQKECCWYKVLVDNAQHSTLIPEDELVFDDSNQPIRHPKTEKYFRGFEDGRYLPGLF